MHASRALPLHLTAFKSSAVMEDSATINEIYFIVRWLLEEKQIEWTVNGWEAMSLFLHNHSTF